MLLIGNGRVITRDSAQPFIECGAVVCDGKVIGYFGEVSPQVITDFEVNHPVIMFELIIQQFAEKKGGGLF